MPSAHMEYGAMSKFNGDPDILHDTSLYYNIMPEVSVTKIDEEVKLF